MSRVTHLLIDTVSIYRESELEKGRGRWQDNLVPLALNIRGRIWTMSAQEQVVGQQRKTYNAPVAYLEPDQDVAPEDYIERSGEWYRVVAVTPPSIPHHTRLVLELIMRGSL
jgi:hypothetical protein